MDIDPLQVETLQPELFLFGETSAGTLELFPAVWAACEELVAPEMQVRQKGLEKLLALKAPRLSPLVTYILATRVTEPDHALRKLVASALADLLLVDSQGLAAPENVRRTLYTYLSQIRQPAILALLEISLSDLDMETKLATLLNVCPEGGRILLEILSDRKNPLELRCQAVRLINRVGYLDTLPELEKLAARLESRSLGQQVMPFVPPASQSEQALLIEIQSALTSLRQP